MAAVAMDGTGERRETARWVVAFGLATLVHVGAIAGLAQWRSAEETPPGEQEIAIDLAPAMVETPSLEAVETTRAADAPGESGAVAPPPAETSTEVQPDAAPVESPETEAPVETAVAATEPPPPETAVPPEVEETAAATPTPVAPVETAREAEPVETARAVAPVETARDADPVEPVPEIAATAPAEAVAPAEPDAVQAASVEAEAPVETAVAAEAIAPPEAEPSESEVVVAALQPEETAAEAPAVAAVRPPPEAVTAEPLRQPPPAPPKPVERRRVAEPKRETPRPRETRPPRKVAAPPVAAGSVPSRASTGRSAPDDLAGRAAAADPDAFRRYTAELAAALKRRLRYPDSARDAGIRGTATLRFTLHRSGRIVAASLVRSAGHPVLDQAALATVAPGSSLPPAPAAVPQQQMTISVPLRFDIR